jgi:large subunit ribosomal protein L9
MKVILTKDVPSLGKEGDLVEVSDGHARNFLFPQNAAVQATPDVLQKLRQKERAQKRQSHKDISAAGELAKKLDGQVVVLKAKVNEGGGLYAAVTEKDIAKALLDAGYKVSAKAVKIDSLIKELGEYKITVELHHGFEAELDVIIEEK